MCLNDNHGIRNSTRYFKRPPLPQTHTHPPQHRANRVRWCADSPHSFFLSVFLSFLSETLALDPLLYPRHAGCPRSSFRALPVGAQKTRQPGSSPGPHIPFGGISPLVYSSSLAFPPQTKRLGFGRTRGASALESGARGSLRTSRSRGITNLFSTRENPPATGRTESFRIDTLTEAG
ncbi:hypothetical protein SRHO_G00152180 [Serrasalmus rhombeus]